ncbi:uncharacterized protein LOC124874907 isoform X4 [Girardinichthys multiradiatus]|uniref:uncharacterized protein LOC124874907 isoform X4 n=1 Tax=Girardinichthys multiradiatus TaxID=208333 RepID=UPI001FAE4A73|nr:uncharacterized protein LOC124874907 isoform X4 [Girardinichthys multiradiatus]
MSRLQTTTVTRRSTSGARMSEMKVEAEDPVWLSLEPPIPAALTSELEQKQDSKDLIHQIKEEAPHGWSSSLDQHHPEPPHIKEEEEELWINQEEEQLAVKIEDEEKFEQMKTEHDGEDDGGPEPDRNPDPECSSQERKMTVHSRGLPNRGRWTALTSRL